MHGLIGLALLYALSASENDDASPGERPDFPGRRQRRGHPFRNRHRGLLRDGERLPRRGPPANPAEDGQGPGVHDRRHRLRDGLRDPDGWKADIDARRRELMKRREDGSISDDEFRAAENSLRQELSGAISEAAKARAFGINGRRQRIEFLEQRIARLKELHADGDPKARADEIVVLERELVDLKQPRPTGEARAKKRRGGRAGWNWAIAGGALVMAVVGILVYRMLSPKVKRKRSDDLPRAFGLR